MRFKAVIFDCDGVLIDSEPISMAVDTSLLHECGLPLSMEEVHRRFVGLTFDAMVEELERQFAVKLPPDLSARKDVRMIAAYRRELQPVQGVRETLPLIPLPKSVGTNGPRDRAVEALRMTGLLDHFDAITTFEDVKDGKPAPDIYLKAAALAGCDPRDCLVVEDSAAGVRAGVAAGCTVFGVTVTHHDAEAHGALLRSLGAQQIVTHMAQLPALVSA